MGERRMEEIVEVAYKKLGDDGYYAHLTVITDQTTRFTKEYEFFSESWKVLCDRVLFFCVELVSDE
jgi:hypothetical protein